MQPRLGKRIEELGQLRQRVEFPGRFSIIKTDAALFRPPKQFAQALDIRSMIHFGHASARCGRMNIIPLRAQLREALMQC